MARLRIPPERIAAVERLVRATEKAGLEHLTAILACTFTFDHVYFESVLEALAECHPEGADLLRSIPVDVVCDRRNYSGHAVGYNVHLWNGENLFHPKVLMLLFTDRIVWVEGSMNLTAAGYMRNRELASYHESTSALPLGIRSLISRLQVDGVDAAKRIAESTRVSRTDPANRSVTTLDTPLLPDLLRRSRGAHSVYVVSPFFDQRDQDGPSIDAAAMHVLAKSYPTAKFHFYLPMRNRPDGETALQGSRSLFVGVFGSNPSSDRVVFCGVPNESPLHAKLIAVRHHSSRTRTTVLTGSPNATEKALMKQGASANVELARELTLHWKDVDVT
jgi:hypothetical protein